MLNKTFWIINQYASTPDTGMGGRTYYLARELARQGYNVYLVAASYHHLLHDSPKVVRECDMQSEKGVNIVWIKVPPYNNAHSVKRIINWFRFAWKLRGLKNVIIEKPDAILCSSPSLVSFLGARYLARYFNARLIFDVRDIWPLTLIELGGYSKNHPFIGFLQWIENKAYRESDHITSNWPYAVEHMVNHGLDRENFTWLPNGFSVEEFENREHLPQAIIDKIPHGKFIVGYTGTLGKANALDVLLNVAEMMKSNKEVVFVIVGGGREEDELIQEINVRELYNVYYLGSITKAQIPSMLSRFDVCYVGFRKSSLYRYGNSLNKLPEYFASKKPIIYSIDSPFKPVDDAQAGITVPAEDPDAIASAIIELSKLSSDERKELGENGYRYALENHEYSVLAKKLTNLLTGE